LGLAGYLDGTKVEYGAEHSLDLNCCDGKEMYKPTNTNIYVRNTDDKQSVGMELKYDHKGANATSALVY